jgi:hypothetical protein
MTTRSAKLNTRDCSLAVSKKSFDAMFGAILVDFEIFSGLAKFKINLILKIGSIDVQVGTASDYKMCTTTPLWEQTSRCRSLIRMSTCAKALSILMICWSFESPKVFDI